MGLTCTILQSVLEAETSTQLLRNVVVKFIFKEKGKNSFFFVENQLIEFLIIPISSMLATDSFLTPPLPRGAGGVKV